MCGGGGGADEMLMTCLCRYATTHASSWGDRTPGSQTPGVPATPSPRQRRTLRRRGLKNGHSRPAGRSAKKAAKCGKITPPQNLNILSVNSSEAPPGTAGNLSLHEHSDIHNRRRAVSAAQRRHHQERHRGSHVTDRDCPTPRLRLRRETWPLPREWRLLCP